MVSYVRFVNISKPDQLSEAYPLSEEASSPSERRTLENVKSESSVLRDEGIPVINPNVLLIEKEIIPGVELRALQGIIANTIHEGFEFL